MTALDIQISVEEGDWPSEDELQGLSTRILDVTVAFLIAEEKQPFPDDPPELSLVFTDDQSIREINAEWRNQDKPTNVLSFPAFPVTPGNMPGRCSATSSSPMRHLSAKRLKWRSLSRSI